MSDFLLPDIGEGIVECELVKWLVSEGDLIEEDQPVAEVMTDKALVEIPAPYKGKITRLYHREGEIAKVHAPLFELVAEDDEAGTQTTADAPREEAVQQAEVAPSGNDDETEDFILPDIGEGIVECEVVEWRVAEGDEIEEDQPIVDVMTDKAMVEITAPKAGRVTQLYYQKEEMARVHSPLFAFVPREREAPSGDTARPSAAPKAESTTPETDQTQAVTAAKAPDTGPRHRTPASPAVRRLVREHDLRLADIQGSGKDGRVLKADIIAHLEKPAEARDKAQPEQGSAATATARVQTPQEVRVEPIKGVRAAMAKHMAAAASTIPHFNYSEDIDVTDLLALRTQLKPDAETRSSRLTLMPFIMKAMALAVREYPVLNSQLNSEATEIRYLPHCNIGMAVDSASGLIVPNVKNVEQLTLLEIADEVARLTEAARSGRVSQEDLRGGTITISNIGALGGTYAAPIINAPEVAIVAIGRTQKLPRFDGAGQVVERSIMTISWAGDHRIIDGGTIARFCNLWKGYLESPQSMLLHLG
ncbi:dihydrolipoyllysine-residue acetyltransferase [Marinobacter salicampi]|uniref:dihydrolipoyllysine-residue acetyltransferase n=1 Tax=Marinobacter salicampi TaxID=435907 RepID=UPI001408E38C|nr:dihydrolipoyllysine-residue acetyltransferase [Marinobacter salicampi]